MTVQLTKIAPEEIEKESFRIIEEEFNYTKRKELDDSTFRIIQRVIHATGDFAFADNMRFSRQAITVGIANLQAGKNILTDVTMVAAGISKPTLANWGGEVICKVADPEIAHLAREKGKTRSEMAINTLLEGRTSRVIGIDGSDVFDMDIDEALEMKKTIENDLFKLSDILSI